MPDQVNDPERPEPLGVAKTTGFAAIRRRSLFLGRRMLRNFVAFSSQMATEYRNKDFMLEDLAQL
jgi:hypothetical protein